MYRLELTVQEGQSIPYHVLFTSHAKSEEKARKGALAAIMRDLDRQGIFAYEVTIVDCVRV